MCFVSDVKPAGWCDVLLEQQGGGRFPPWDECLRCSNKHSASVAEKGERVGKGTGRKREGEGSMNRQKEGVGQFVVILSAGTGRGKSGCIDGKGEGI